MPSDTADTFSDDASPGPANLAELVSELIQDIRADRHAEERFCELDHLTRLYSVQVCQACNTRWLSAICDSYADHAPAEEAAAALSISGLIHMVRLAETTRLLRPNISQDRLHDMKEAPFSLYDGLQTLHLDDQDALLNLSKRLYRVTATLPHLRMILETVLYRLHDANSVLAQFRDISDRPERWLPLDPRLPDNFGVI